MNKDRIVFVNIGWMIKYSSVSVLDPTLGGHGYLKGNKFGHEAWNFLPNQGNMYGYVPRSSRINIRNLGADNESQKISGVTVVWIARSPRDKKIYIVGWYREATIYNDSDHIILRRPGNFDVGYQIVAPAEYAMLLPIDQRLFQIPTAGSNGRGNLGQSPLWYGRDDNFRYSVISYIESEGKIPTSNISKSKK